MRKLILAGLLLISTSSFANSRGQIIDNISRLSSRIQLKVLDTNVSDQELRVVQNGLKTLLNKLSNQMDHKCLDFTLDIYERTYSGPMALSRAKAACEMIDDVSLVRFVYEIYLQSYTEVFALERSIDKTEGHNFFGKSDELEFIYSIYKQSYTNKFAIDKSLEKVKLLQSDSMDCLEVTYRTLSRSYSPKFAIDKAIDSCK